MNFVPTRPIEEIAREYVNAFWQLYDPLNHLNRTYRHFLRLGVPEHKAPVRKINWINVRALLIVCWRQGVVRKTRWQFWRNLASILKQNPRVWDQYLSTCASSEHFSEYRLIVREQIEAQLAALLAAQVPTSLEHSKLPQQEKAIA